MASSLKKIRRPDQGKEKIVFRQPVRVESISLEKCWSYIPLLRAMIRGDWETAERFFHQNEGALGARINELMETALLVAVGTGSKAIRLVEKLVELMPEEDLELADGSGETALHIAAWVGNTKAAQVLVRKRPRLVYLQDNHGRLPIHMAALNARRETLLHLLTVTEADNEARPFAEKSGAMIIVYVISSNFYDIALDLVGRYPHLATLQTPTGACALERIAKKVTAFPSGSHLNFWQRIIYSYVPLKLEKYSNDRNTGDVENPHNISPVTDAHKKKWAQSCGENFSISGHPVSQTLQALLWKVMELLVPSQTKRIRERKLIHVHAQQLVKSLCEKIFTLHAVDAYWNIAHAAMVRAILIGIPEVIEEIAYWFPTLVWARDSEGLNLFQLAIIHRQENVFNLIYQMSDHKYAATTFQDAKSGDTMLHLAGRLSPPNKLNLVPGAALKMQRELQWFEEVKKFVYPDYIEVRNNKDETPDMVFTSAHKDLVIEGEKWMKDTANSCTIAAGLIATGVFAAALTVPGGINGTNGLPIFAYQKVFLIFAISDAISLFTSTTSLLMFLSILTSRYAEGDFLYVLPKRLISGMVTLFLSITTMMVAFGSTLYLLFGQNKSWWILLLGAVLPCLPIYYFVSLQFPLLLDLISSTYRPNLFGKRSDRPLY